MPMLFKNCILNSGAGRDEDHITDSGIQLWDQVDRIITNLEKLNPQFSKEQALTNAVKKIGQTYKTTTAIRALAGPNNSSPTRTGRDLRHRGKDGKERDRDRRPQKGSVKALSTRTDSSSDEDKPRKDTKGRSGTNMDSETLHGHIAMLQKLYNGMETEATKKGSARSVTADTNNKGPRSGQGRPPMNTYGGSNQPGATIEHCLDCGKAHRGTCYMMVNGTFSLEKLAAMLRKAPNPAEAVEKTLKWDWPRATNQKFTVQQAATLKRLVNDRK